MTERNAFNERLSREEWLAQALEILALEGQAKLRVDAICTALGVTKGSFYWHFKDRDDFVHSVVKFWGDRFTDPVMKQVTQFGGSARDRLKALMRTVSEGRFARYDVSIRAWAAQDPELIAEIVKTVDRRRLAFVGSLFAELGFEGKEAEMRARAVVAYLSFEESILAKSSRKDRSKMLNQFAQLITQ
ncbi:MAG: TetR/AcrR family transcriptional regulator [Hyphomicrobiaceae bacterium]